jgi:hypothetical protein
MKIGSQNTGWCKCLVTGAEDQTKNRLSSTCSKRAENLIFLREKPAKNERKPGFAGPGLREVWTNVVNRVCEDQKPEMNRT